jgi:periplasmic divalent cation tolerance protein
VSLNAVSYLMAVTTAPSEEAATKLVRSLVERRIIACGTILSGATSIYRWKGAVETAAEVVVLMKTTASRWEALKQELPRLHPYEVPELLALPVAGGHQPYLDWLSAETNDGTVETS